MLKQAAQVDKETLFLRPAKGSCLIKGDALDGKRNLFFMFSAASESRRKHAFFFLLPG